MSLDPAQNAAHLRSKAEAEAAVLPALLAQAQRLAGQISLGAHGRKRAGHGEEFWQYRPAVQGDNLRDIDWRRSARSDAEFIRQHEWQISQHVQLWVDDGAAMRFSTLATDETKYQRSSVLALALAILLNKAGERFGLMQDPNPGNNGQLQINRMVMDLLDEGDLPDYAEPPFKVLPTGARAVYFSDFLGDWKKLTQSLGLAANQNVRGVLVQVLDPSEIDFPFKGRTEFESMKGTLQFDTLRADALREDYLAQMAARQEQLRELAKATGWRVLIHRTDEAAQDALLWLYNAVAERV